MVATSDQVGRFILVMAGLERCIRRRLTDALDLPQLTSEGPFAKQIQAFSMMVEFQFQSDDRLSVILAMLSRAQQLFQMRHALVRGHFAAANVARLEDLILEATLLGDEFESFPFPSTESAGGLPTPDI